MKKSPIMLMGSVLINRNLISQAEYDSALAQYESMTAEGMKIVTGIVAQKPNG